MKVNFMIIGAQKSGTSSLAYQLSQHPQICFSKKKEPHFFSKSKDWRKGLKNYHEIFEPQSGQLCGEASTTYTFQPDFSHTPSWLFEYNPELKFIYIMRQPVGRIVSHYMHRLVHGRAKGRPDTDVFRSNYINVSRYGMQLEPYLELFPLKNILLIIFEEFNSNPIKILEQVSLFLEIDTGGFKGIDMSPKNVTVGKRYVKRFLGSSFLEKHLKKAPSPIRRVASKYLYFEIQEKIEFPNWLKQTLWKTLEDDVIRVEELLGRPLDIWRNGYTD